MPTYKLTVIDVRRLVVLVNAPTLKEAQEKWRQAQLLETQSVETEVISATVVEP